MSNPSGPDHDAESSSPQDSTHAENPGQPDNSDSEDTAAVERQADPETEIIAAQNADSDADEMRLPSVTPGERRFTAPSGMDAGSTQIIDRPPDEPETEIIGIVGGVHATGETPKVATPQSIPPRISTPKLPARNRSWGWVLAVILVIAALVAIAVLGTVLLTRNSSQQSSTEDRVRDTIQSFDTAIQTGDLATLRSITCGATADGYNKYDDKKWADTHARVAAAKQYPVVASIDQVIVNGDHAEANVTSFMASDPGTRSTRSFDLQFRDDQWKICQDAQ
jgi:Domain of unknown function (DUF4878)